uniref:Uncharacterized protein n=1 Tax=Cacopsylla melanoneura TaxID=428564 RepID=A0A8D8UZG0_9HEMI
MGNQPDGHCDATQTGRRTIRGCVRGGVEEVQHDSGCENVEGGHYGFKRLSRRGGNHEGNETSEPGPAARCMYARAPVLHHHRVHVQGQPVRLSPHGQQGTHQRSSPHVYGNADSQWNVLSGV